MADPGRRIVAHRVAFRFGVWHEPCRHRQHGGRWPLRYAAVRLGAGARPRARAPLESPDRALAVRARFCATLRGMFTGIVQAVGKVVCLTPLEVDCDGFDLADVRVGDSICVQGVCLTVTALTGRGFTADVSSETRAVSTGLNRTDAVNLEKSLALGERLGGHLVAGHVDGVGEVVRRDGSVFAFRAPQ